MVTDEQVRQANEIARKGFEVTKRIYDLATVAWQQMSEDVMEQLNLKKRVGWWSSGDANFLQRYGQLNESERIVLKRYCYTAYGGTKSRQLPEDVVPFILFSIATRKFSQQPALIYGILRDVDWKGQKAEIEPFMYAISEKRQHGGLEVSGLNVLSKQGSANVQFNMRSLFEITDDTIGDITQEMINWFQENLPNY